MMCLFPSLGLFPSFFLCSLSIDGTGEVVPLARETEEPQHKEKKSLFEFGFVRSSCVRHIATAHT